MTVTTKIENLKPTDFASDQEVRWCPGCGDYAILKAVQRTLSEEGAQRENTVFVSGIGCSSRLPYYMSTYGFHTIHGRAPAFATGIKLTNPSLDVWVITGDGDGLSIGGNHLMHALRRNVNFQILLFNNETYGLTKGQYSPTSRPGTRSPSSPSGSIDFPFMPCVLALGAGANFVARGVDTAVKDLTETFKRARAFPGTAFVEIFQNCIVYNDKVFANFTDRDVSLDLQVVATHGMPLMFGAEKNRGLRFDPTRVQIEVVVIGENGVTKDGPARYIDKSILNKEILLGKFMQHWISAERVFDDETSRSNRSQMQARGKSKCPTPQMWRKPNLIGTCQSLDLDTFGYSTCD